MNIGLVCNEYLPAPQGGIGTFVHTFAHGLSAAGHTFRVIGIGKRADTRFDGPVRVDTLRSSGVPRLSWLLDRLHLQRYLGSLARKKQLDVVELPDYEGLLPLRFSACPVAVRLHLSSTSIARHSGRTPRRLTYRCESRTLSLHRNWIPVSRHALALTSRDFSLQPTLSQVIYYPVSAAALDRDAPGIPATFVLFAGTVTERKGALRLAGAARDFLARHPECHLLYAGGTSPIGDVPVEKIIADIVGPNLAERVRFLGRIERGQLAQYMRRASVFAFPSTLETFGLVVAEAMLNGCPVVTSDQAPFTEFVEHGRSGLLVRSGDVAGLAAAIDNLLSNRSLARTLAACGQQTIRSRFSLENAIGQSLEFYRSLPVVG